jgi:hypothetical protein
MPSPDPDSKSRSQHEEWHDDRDKAREEEGLEITDAQPHGKHVLGPYGDFIRFPSEPTERVEEEIGISGDLGGQ